MTCRLGAALAFLLLLVPANPSAADPPGSTPPNNSFDARGSDEAVFVDVREEVRDPGSAANAPIPAAPAAVVEDPYEYRTTLGCGNKADPDANDDPTNCTYGLTVCATAANPDGVLYYSWMRRQGAGAPWRFWGESCSLAALPPAPAPAAVPSMVQIREAFAQLPFATPRVSIQPVGGRTLVNLPTFYEVVWEPGGLAPGSVSAPVQLLSWSVEFEVQTQYYTFDFGDGTRSDPTTDPGGPYPSGAIRHAYKDTLPAAEVRVDAVLTGRFRVNGGPWQELRSVADLQNEPVTPLEVLEARARLVR